MARMLPSVAVLAFAFSAAPSVASNLSNCRGIDDRSARLDCYDRLAKAEEDAITTAALTDVPDARTGVDMSGFYVGFSGSTSSGLNTDKPISHGAGGGSGIYSSSSDPSLQLATGALGGFAGYNFIDGATLFGVEASIDRKLQPSVMGESWFSYDQPIGSVWGWSSTCVGCSQYPPGTSFFDQMGGTLRSRQHYYVELEETATPVLSVRFGRQIGNALIYGRLGAGAMIYDLTSVDDRSGSISCASTRMRADTFVGLYSLTTFSTAGCNLPYEPASTRTVIADNEIAPVLQLGLGGEYWFDRAFVRGEALMTGTFFGSNLGFTEQTVFSGTGKLAVGVRF